MIRQKQSCVIDDEMLRLLSPAFSSYYQRPFHSLFTFSRHHAFAPRGLLLFEKPANNFSFFESLQFLRCVIPAISVIDHQYFLDLPASHTLAILAAYHIKWSSRRAYHWQEQWLTTATTFLSRLTDTKSASSSCSVSHDNCFHFLLAYRPTLARIVFALTLLPSYRQCCRWFDLKH